MRKGTSTLVEIKGDLQKKNRSGWRTLVQDLPIHFFLSLEYSGDRDRDNVTGDTSSKISSAVKQPSSVKISVFSIVCPVHFT